MPRHTNPTTTEEASFTPNCSTANIVKYLKAAHLFVEAAKEQDPSRWGINKNRMMSLKALIASLFIYEDHPITYSRGLYSCDVSSKCRQIMELMNRCPKSYLNEEIPWYSGRLFSRPHSAYCSLVSPNSETTYDAGLLQVLRNYGLVGYDSGRIKPKKLIEKARDHHNFGKCRRVLGWFNSSFTPTETVESASTSTLEPVETLSTEEKLRSKLLGECSWNQIKVYLTVEHFINVGGAWIEIKATKYFHPSNCGALPGITREQAERIFNQNGYRFRVKISINDNKPFYLGNGRGLRKCGPMTREAVMKAILGHLTLPDLLLSQKQLPLNTTVFGSQPTDINSLN